MDILSRATTLVFQFCDLLFNPQFFRNFFLAIVALFFLGVFIYLIQSGWQNRASEKQARLERESWKRELEAYKNKNIELSNLINTLKNQLDIQDRQISEISKLREDLARKDLALKKEASDRERLSAGLNEELKTKDESLRKEILTKEKLFSELKNAEGSTASIQKELKSLREVYQGLKEQYADLERQADALSQQLALEKTLHQRLKEEHKACKNSNPPEPSSP